MYTYVSNFWEMADRRKDLLTALSNLFTKLTDPWEEVGNFQENLLLTRIARVTLNPE